MFYPLSKEIAIDHRELDELELDDDFTITPSKYNTEVKECTPDTPNSENETPKKDRFEGGIHIKKIESEIREVKFGDYSKCKLFFVGLLRDSILVIIIFVILGGILGIFTIISLLVGFSSLHNGSISIINHVSDLFEGHLKFQESLLYSNSLLPVFNHFVCGQPQFNNVSKNEIESMMVDYLSTFTQHNLHHYRIIDRNGIEKLRIDIEHDDATTSSSIYFNVSSKVYHQDFLNNLSYSTPSYTKWENHKVGNTTDYFGSDEDGDHIKGHEAFCDLPSLIKVQKSIVCNGVPQAYIILNVRMIKFLSKLVDVSALMGDYFILNEEGDYVYNSIDRSTEFQLSRGIQPYFITSYLRGKTILKQLQRLNRTNNFVNYPREIRESYLICGVMFSGDYKYFPCFRYSIHDAIFNSSYFIIGMGAAFLFLLFLIIFNLFTKNFAFRKEKKRYSSLLEKIYPQYILPRLLKGIEMIVEQQNNGVICFIDICNFTNTTKEMSPKSLVLFLCNIFHTMDSVGRCYNIQKIKTVGDCYFCISTKDEKEKNENSHVLKMMLFSSFIIHFAKNHDVQMIHYDDEIVYEKIKFRIGIHYGSYVGGILDTSQPLFDIWGMDVNLAARIESGGESNRVHISEEMYNVVKDNFGALFSFEKRNKMKFKGFNKRNTYFAKLIDEKFPIKVHNSAHSYIGERVFECTTECFHNNEMDIQNSSSRNLESQILVLSK